MSGSADKAAWVSRVLGYSFSTKRSVDAVGVRAIWFQAKEQVDERISDLARELRSYDDQDLSQIAEFGLFGLSGGREVVGLTSALMEFETAVIDRRADAKARLAKAIEVYRTVLTSNPLIKMVDENPFDVEVALQATLGGALTRIEQAIG